MNKGIIKNRVLRYSAHSCHTFGLLRHAWRLLRHVCGYMSAYTCHRDVVRRAPNPTPNVKLIWHHTVGGQSFPASHFKLATVTANIKKLSIQSVTDGIESPLNISIA